MVALFYPDISNFTFWNVKIQNVKIFLIDFLHELGNFKQKNFYTSKFYILKCQGRTTQPLVISSCQKWVLAT